MSNDEEMKEDFIELRSYLALEMQFERETLDSLGARLCLCFQKV